MALRFNNGRGAVTCDICNIIIRENIGPKEYGAMKKGQEELDICDICKNIKPVSKIDSFRDENAFLSNFYPTKVIYGMQEYNTVENAYQAAKCEDLETRRLFINCTPGQAKRLGAKMTVPKKWRTYKIKLMHNLLQQKFDVYKSPILAKKLIDTGDAELIEGNNWHDTFWGVCDGVGENHLGKLLMEVRTEIKNAMSRKIN